MNKENIIPSFSTEAEEADWWFEHQDQLLEQFKQASEEGRLGRGTALRRIREQQAKVASATVTVHVTSDDEAKARSLAAQQGLQYEALLEQIIHQGLQKPKSESHSHH